MWIIAVPILVCLAQGTHAGDGAASTPSASTDAGSQYSDQIRPLLEQYCIECHSGDQPEADIDFGHFRSLDDVRKTPRTWQKVREMLDSRDMPPADAPQPTDEERSVLRTWVHHHLTLEAEKQADDPGRVVLRRLSNAEYTYTVRDLTGVMTLDPAREFPVDGAAGEGFTNTGDALVMSPSLITKYLDAAKGIASHAVLLPDGIEFSRYTTRRDWTNERLERIRDFYRQFSADTGGEEVNLQGIVFETNEGGRLPVKPYVAATLIHRPSLTTGTQTPVQIADQLGLNAKYLDLLWRTFARQDENHPSLLLDDLRARWQVATPAEASQLTDIITAWQQAVWQFNPVGQVGREGGPQRWQEPNDPIVAKQELRLRLPESANGRGITVYLIAGDAGDGNQGDYVVWHRPRLIISDQPDRPLRDVAASPGSPVDPASSPRASSSDGSPSQTLPVVRDLQFGRHPDGSSIDAESLCVHAPSILEVHLPAELAGAELVMVGSLHDGTGAEGTVQLRALATATDDAPADFIGSMAWRGPVPSAPFIATENSAARHRLARSLAEFREVFPAALCYTRIVPVDEVVTLILFYREDEQLKRLMLDDQQSAQLDRLWDQLLYVSQEPLALTVAYEQIAEFATQDRPDLVIAFKPLRKPIFDRAESFRQRMRATQPVHLQGVVDLADRAWRRPLSQAEEQELRDLYETLLADDVSHDEAIRLLLARVLTSPHFLYKLEQPAPGIDPKPVSRHELATRLSYFLWSSMPDESLRHLADTGELTDDESIVSQTRRMLRDARSRRLAIQFACQWLHIRDFADNDDKNEALYPEFAALRRDMYEESVRFFEEMIRNDRPVLDLLNADYTYVNGPLAAHYGIESLTGPAWRRVEAVNQYGRGGILGMASMLAMTSGASRTSPVLRGAWVSETLLGERLPRPPAGVPQLPDVVPAGLTARQLIERHSSAPECAKCHQRIDPYGFALEQYDAIGRMRPATVDTRTELVDGETIEGFNGLRNYLLNDRRDDIVRQFCRKLLGYSLGREIQLSDEPLLARMQSKLEMNNYHFGAAVETVVTSRQFRDIRGKSASVDDDGIFNER